MPSEMEVAPLTEHSFTINRRSDTGFGTWLENSLQWQNLGLLDKIGTFLGPFWDLSGTFVVILMILPQNNTED